MGEEKSKRPDKNIQWLLKLLFGTGPVASAHNPLTKTSPQGGNQEDTTRHMAMTSFYRKGVVNKWENYTASHNVIKQYCLGTTVRGRLEDITWEV